MKMLKILGQELPLRVSPSFLQKAACPFCLKCAYIDKIENRFIRVNTMRGSAAHEAIAHLTKIAYDESVSISELDDDAVMEAVHKYTPHEIISEQTSILKWVRLWRSKFHSTKNYVGHEEKMAIDEDYEECSWDTGAYRGIVDHIELEPGGTCTYTDYKSQAHIMSQAELNEHEQLTFYAWLVSKFYPHAKRFVARIWYLRYGFYGESRRTLDDIELFEQGMRLRIQKISDIEDWRALPGDHCGVCDYIHLCPVAQDLSMPPKHVISQAQAEQAAARLRVLEVLTSSLKSGLKGYVKANDAVRLGGDFIYGFKPSTSHNWDAATLASILVENGHHLAEFATVDKRAMKKFLKSIHDKDPELFDQVMQIADTKTTTAFRGYKATDDADTEESEDGME